VTIRLPPRQVLVHDVYEALKGLVMDQVVAPGARMNVDALARELGVSPTPVREALARLEADGVVTKAPLRGWSAVGALTPEGFGQAFELRLLIEPWAAARAAERIERGGVEALERELRSLPGAPEGTAYPDYRELSMHDARFHDLVAALGGNEPLRAALERLHPHLHLYRLYYRRGIGAEALREHREVAAAICAGSPEGAREAMSTHIEASRERLEAFMA